MATIVDNLLLKLGVTGAGQVKSARAEVSGLLNAFSKLIGISAGIYAVTSAVSDFVSEAVNLGNVSKATGIAVESLSAWKQALEAAGEDGNAFLGTVKGITDNVSNYLMSGSGDIVPYLGRLGVGVQNANGEMRDATDILMDIANQWESFSSRDQTMIGQHLGIDEGTIRMMQRGGKEVQQLLDNQKELGVITSSHAKSAQAVSTAYYGLKNTWRVVSYALSADLLPALEWGLLKLNDASRWIAENKPVVYGFLIGLTALFAKVAIGWVLAFAPALAIVAILTAIGTAIYYLYDDFMVWRRGGIVAFGEVWKAADKMAGGIKAIFEKVKTFLIGVWNDPKKAWNETVEYFRNRWKGMSLAEIGKDIINSFGAAIKSAWDEYIFPFLRTIDDKFKQWFGVSLIDEGAKLINSFLEGVKNTFVKVEKFFVNYPWRDMGRKVGAAIVDAVVAALDFASSIEGSDWGSVGEAIKNGLIRALKFVYSVTDAIIETVQGVIEGIFSGLWTKLSSFLDGWVEKAKNKLKDIPLIGRAFGDSKTADSEASNPKASDSDPSSQRKEEAGSFERALGYLEGLVLKITNPIGTAAGMLGDMIDTAANQAQPASPAMALGITGGGTSYHMNKSTTIQNLNVTAQGNNPRQHANAVSNILVGRDSNSSMSMNSENGTKR